MSFVADQIPYLKWIPEILGASVQNERVKPSKILSRTRFLQVQDLELNALSGVFSKYTLFQRNTSQGEWSF